MDEPILQRAVKEVARKMGLAEPPRCHTLRQSFAMHAEDGDDARATQQLLVH
ncbi:MAG: hypothetical protein ACRERE_05310 [Candidatus Entotheonellia bacterium]